MVQTKRWMGIITLVWVGLALVGGGVAGWFGYRLGQEALSKVRQPMLSTVTDETYPTNTNNDPKPFRLLNETEMIYQALVVMGTAK